ncbi:peptidase domain-containing ABC transporter [Aporhodopirellula aestuarii]|uniref:ATP-binding cassette domain-containing protein n=1 Tax=Aporhodopirellula aestuarii TaxID=2950107 RepID=A0ABT0TZW6_9BACT|nr:ATP-binding cassette domain-containing protein [Aporhodopirellula aestuarii]MCM2370156.1 ATP-binding cassette domain-containing protein [Aporhodopirellula aestuarii]
MITPDDRATPPIGPAAQQRLAGEGAATLERLVRDRVKMERTTVLRTFHLTLESHEGTLPDQWWQIFTDAASGLQLRPAVLDCSVDQVVRLISDGADVVAFSRGKLEPLSADVTAEGQASCVEFPRWFLIHQNAKSRTVIWESNHDKEETVSERELRRRLEPLAEDERIRCIAFDWRELSISGGEHGSAAPMKPLTRLVHLVRPEWTDIWLVIVFAFVVGLFTLATPIAVEALVNTVAFGRFVQPIVVLALILLFFLSVSAAMLALQTYIVEIIQQRLFARVAGDLAHRLPRVSTEGVEDQYLPELTNRFFDVVTVQKATASILLDGIALVMSAAIGMIVLGFYHPFLLGFDALLVASIVFLIIVLGRGAVKTAVKESKSKYYMAAWLEDVSRCHTTFQSAAGKRLSASRSDRLVYDYLVNRKRHFRVLLRQILFALGLQAIASTALLGLGGYLVIAGELTLGQLVAAELIVAVIVGAFAKMGKHLEGFYDLLASVDKLGVLFDLPMARQGTGLHMTSDEPVAVELDNVTYHRAGTKNIFAPVTAHLPAGSSTAVVGRSGAGKSTMLDLIHGVRRPTAGIVLVDSSQPSDFQSDDFWNRVELVRDGEVFSASVEENVHVQRTDVSGQDVEDALQAVGIADTLNALPDGMQTHLASSGAPLASNQVRLVLLARAIASRPNLMLIDGLLDSLSDEEAERILNHLLAPERPWTIIIATGRQWIANRCDHTIELRSSRIGKQLDTYASTTAEKV